MKNCFALIAFALLLAACSSSPGKTDERPEGEPAPAPTATRPCEFTLKLRAEAKKGLRTLGKDADYGETGKERADAKIKRVDYGRLKDIVVVIEGPGKAEVSDQPKQDPAVEISDDGFSHDMVAVMLQRPRDDADARAIGKKMSGDDKVAGDVAAMAKSLDLGASVNLTNNRAIPVTIYGAAGSDDSFEITLKPGKSRYVFFRNAGVYDIYCEEDETMHLGVVVSNSAYVRTATSGDDVKFFLPLGQFDVKVYAPRLPVWTAELTFEAAGKVELTAKLGVNALPKK